MIERDSDELSVRQQAALLGLNRSSLYYQPAAISAREVAIKHRIDEIYTEHPFYGSRRITVELRQEMPINRKTVQRYMAEMGLVALYPGPKLSQPNPAHQVYPYLLRGLKASYPNHVWGIDITYIRLRRSWMYLVAILDWYSRYVVSWELAQSLEQEFVLLAVDHALAQARPAICNSDQGSHFTSSDYLDRLKAAQVRISMDGRGRALDNVFTERLWRTIKYEEVYIHEYDSPRQVRQGLTHYLTFYNYQRPHSALHYQPPAAVYFQEPLSAHQTLTTERSSVAL